MNCTSLTFDEIFKMMELYKEKQGDYPEKVILLGKALMDLKPEYDKFHKELNNNDLKE